MATTQTRNVKAKAKRPVAGMKAASVNTTARKIRPISFMGERLMINDAGKVFVESTGEIMPTARLMKFQAWLGQVVAPLNH